MIVRELFAKLGLKVDEGGFSKGTAAIGGLKLGLAAVGLSLGVVVAKLSHIVEATTGAALGANKAAQRIGVTRDAFQELAFAAEHSGLSADGLEQSLKFLNRSVYEASHGGSEAVTTFRRLGVSVRDGAGKARSADAVMMDLAERFKAMPDGAEKTALAMKLFGRSGTEIIPMLNKGREGIAEYREEAHKLGMVMGDEVIAAAKEYKAATMSLNENIEVLERTIGVALMPKIAAMKRQLAGWIEQNRAMIRQRVETFFKALAAAITRVWQVTEMLFDAGSRILQWVADLTSGSTDAKMVVTALAIALGLLFAPATTAIIVFLTLLEEVWGWMTGKRKTLLEDAFGPFDQFQKMINGSFTSLFEQDWQNSPLISSVKTLAWAINQVVGFIQKAIDLRDELFGKPKWLEPVWMTPVRALTKASEKQHSFGEKAYSFLAYGQSFDASQSEKAAGEYFRSLPSARRAQLQSQWGLELQGKGLGMMDSYRFMDRKREELYLASQSASSPAALAAPTVGPTGVPSRVSIGDVYVTAPAGSDPKAFGDAFSQAINEKLQNLFSDAYPAVAR